MFEREPTTLATIGWGDLSANDKGDILTFAVNTVNTFYRTGTYEKISHIKVIRSAFPGLSLKTAKTFAEMADVHRSNIYYN